MTLSAHDILGRLEQIDNLLASKQAEAETAAEDVVRTDREMELRLARTKLTTNAKTETEKKDKALTSIAAAEDDLYERWVDATARHHSLKAAVKVLELRTSIGQSLLKWQRETGG